MSTVSDKQVRFVTFTALLLYNNADLAHSPALTSMASFMSKTMVRIIAVWGCEHVLNIPLSGIVAPIEREVRNLAIGLQGVKDEQEYIVVREKTHRNTAESTNDRVKWWSIAQTFLLFAVCGWQIYYLKVGRVRPK